MVGGEKERKKERKKCRGKEIEEIWLTNDKLGAPINHELQTAIC